MSTSTNFVGDALGDAASASLASVTTQRQTQLQMTQANALAVLVPQQPGGLSYALRAAMAARIARTSNEEQLARLFEGAFDGARDDDFAVIASGALYAGSNKRTVALLKHLDLVTATPWMAEGAEIETLRAAAIDEADIVRLSQLAGCISYVVRVVAGLRALGEAA